MSRALAMAAVVLTMCAGQSLEGFAQTRPQSPPASIQDGQVMEGRVADVKGRWIVLANGAQVAVPDNVIRRPEVKPGAFIRVMFEEREGQKFATSIQLRDALEDLQ
jgi:hypothetical protein